MGEFENAFHLHEKCLEYKLAIHNGVNHEQVMSSFVMLAHVCQKLQDHVAATDYFQKALTVCRTLHGDFTETTAYSMVQLAEAYVLADNMQSAIDCLEHAGMILSKLEMQKVDAKG